MSDESRPTPPTEVDRIFRENSDKILALMTEVLAQAGINGYSVHNVQISVPPRPNPDICIPYVKGVPGNGLEFGCTYVEVG